MADQTPPVHPAPPTSDSSTQKEAATKKKRLSYRRYALVDNDGGIVKKIKATCDDGAKLLAIKWMREGYSTDGETYWVKVQVFSGWHSQNSATRIATHKVAIHPQEPECTKKQHKWIAPHEVVGGLEDNPGVWGHGGGVRIHDLCKHCGVHRHVDTWAQDRSDGEQGLTSTRFVIADTSEGEL